MYFSKKMATKSNNANEQTPSVGIDEMNDNNTSLSSVTIPNGNHDVKVTSDKLCDDISSMASSLRKEDVLTAATAGK